MEKIRAVLLSDESVFTVTGTDSGRVKRPVCADKYYLPCILETVKLKTNGNRYLELLCDHLAEYFNV